MPKEMISQGRPDAAATKTPCPSNDAPERCDGQTTSLRSVTTTTHSRKYHAESPLGVGFTAGETVALGGGTLIGGEGLVAGDAVISGEGFLAGEAAVAGEGLAVGEALAPGSLIGVDAPATSFHSPLRRAKVSTKRYWPLISIDLPSGILYFPFFTTLRPRTTAASLLSTVTLRSNTSHESALSAPRYMSCKSVALSPTVHKGKTNPASSASTRFTAWTSFSLTTRGQSSSIRVNSVSIAAVSTVSAVGLAAGAIVFAFSAAFWQPPKSTKEKINDSMTKTPFCFIDPLLCL